MGETRKMIEIVSNLGIVIIIGVMAFFAGMFGDLESDVSSNNPNSRILHAPEHGKLHKLFTRVISSTAILLTTMTTISGTFTQVFMELNIPVVVILILAPLITTVLHVIVIATKYMGQMVGNAMYDQPLYIDVLFNNIPTIAAYSYICLFSITFMSYMTIYELTPKQYLSMPVLTFILGLLLGCVTSIVGDIYSGAEVLYQHRKKGEVIPEDESFDITTKEAEFSRNSIDILYLTSKFSGPASGLCFALIIFLIFWLFILFGSHYGIVIGFLVTIAIFIINYVMDVSAHKRFDKNKKESE